MDSEKNILATLEKRLELEVKSKVYKHALLNMETRVMLASAAIYSQVHDYFMWSTARLRINDLCLEIGDELAKREL